MKPPPADDVTAPEMQVAMPEQAELVPVYAEFGAAVHDTQVLEFGLVLLMALATRYDDANFGSAAVESLASVDAGKTVGELFRAVRKKEHFTAPERKAIHKAIRLRNDLVHRFLVQKVEALLTADGRRGLLREIRRIRKAVQRADRIVASLIDRYLEEYGTSLDELQDYAAELFDVPEGAADGE
jgi:hypothetical protein